MLAWTHSDAGPAISKFDMVLFDHIKGQKGLLQGYKVAWFMDSEAREAGLILQYRLCSMPP